MYIRYMYLHYLSSFPPLPLQAPASQCPRRMTGLYNNGIFISVSEEYIYYMWAMIGVINKSIIEVSLSLKTPYLLQFPSITFMKGAKALRKASVARLRSSRT